MKEWAFGDAIARLALCISDEPGRYLSKCTLLSVEGLMTEEGVKTHHARNVQ